jgi:hypothetical protein
MKAGGVFSIFCLYYDPLFCCVNYVRIIIDYVYDLNVYMYLVESHNTSPLSRPNGWGP